MMIGWHKYSNANSGEIGNKPVTTTNYTSINKMLHGIIEIPCILLPKTRNKNNEKSDEIKKQLFVNIQSLHFIF